MTSYIYPAETYAIHLSGKKSVTKEEEISGKEEGPVSEPQSLIGSDDSFEPQNTSHSCRQPSPQCTLEQGHIPS